MSGILLDTSILIAAERNHIELGAVIAGRMDVCFISVVTASELLNGVYRADTSDRKVRRAAMVEEAISSFSILDIDLATARVHSKIVADTESSGNLVGVNDLWIAASAISQGLSVMTRNGREFKRVPGLPVIEV